MKTKQLLKFSLIGSLFLAGCAATKSSPMVAADINNSSQNITQIRAIKAQDLAPVIGPFVEANLYGNLVYTSGQIGLTKNGEFAGSDIKSQTHQVIDNLKEVLNAAGTDLNHVIKTTCFLSDMKNFAAFNEVYASYFNGSFPARSCVGVASLPKNALVEVEVIAAIPTPVVFEK